MGDVLRDEELGTKLCDSPDEYFTEDKKEILKKSMTQLFKFVSIEINASIKEYVDDLPEGQLFDYKNLFKNRQFIDKISNEVLRGRKRALLRNPEDACCEMFNAALQSL